MNIYLLQSIFLIWISVLYWLESFDFGIFAQALFNRAGQALRQAASNARNSNSFIGASHRARLARMDGASAVKATAHQLARLIYAMLTKGQPYVEKGIEAFEARTQDRQLKALQRKARKFGLELIEAT